MLANPQKENGYTAIANEILEQIARYKLNGTQYAIVIVLLRYTYGFNRTEHDLSVDFIVNATGIAKRQVQRELKFLIDNHIVIVSKEATFNTPRILKFNKNYDEWCLARREVTKKTPHDGKVIHTGDELVISTGDELVTQERKYKDNIKEIYKEEEKEKAPIDIGFQKVRKSYEQNIGMFPPAIFHKVNEWLNEVEADVIVAAIEEAVMRNARNFQYINSILVDWYDKGIYTKELLDVYRKDQETQRNQKEVKKNASNKRNHTSSGGYKQSEETKRLDRIAREKGWRTEFGDTECNF